MGLFDTVHILELFGLIAIIPFMVMFMVMFMVIWSCLSTVHY